MVRVAIIGGGISGLTTAFYLEQERRRGVPVDFVVFESEPRFGGVIQTERVDGCIIEAGPDSFLTAKPWARELCDDLRLSSQLIGSRDAERKTYILVDGHLEPIPLGMQMMVPTKVAPVFTSRLFSGKTKWSMIREYLSPPDPLAADNDETVASFVSRHFNSEVVDRLADPLLTGVYGGDTSVLSVRATLPQMVDSECRHRSLVRGALAARKTSNAKSEPPPLFTAMRDGMQRMVESIVRQLPRETLRCSRQVDAMKARETGWQIASGGATEDFDQVILALPAHSCAKLMSDVSGAERIVEILGEISYSSAVTVALAYKSSEIALPPGFGFLVPRNQAKRMIACTFVHKKFENRAPEDTALLRVFMGGARDAEILDLSNSEILEVVRRELREILNIAAEPRIVRIFRWRKAMAQYEVGHLLRIARLEMHVQRFAGLHLAGNAYHGIGIPDCVRLGRSAADAIMRRVRAQRVPV
jgi:protoporphyrinogen/coproporphyrinogen III oxidase